MSLEEIKSEIDLLAERVGGTSSEVLPTYGYSEQTGRPHIEVDGLGYHYVVAERGEEFARLTTQALDELLYNVFRSVTHELAFGYELQHRVEGQDSRRLAFQRQTELFLLLSPEWARCHSDEVNKILEAHPFDDSASAQATLMKELRDQGHTPEDARRIAAKNTRPLSR